jgi:hypothetical protein
MRNSLAVMALALLLAGCASHAQEAATPRPKPRVYVQTIPRDPKSPDIRLPDPGQVLNPPPQVETKEPPVASPKAPPTRAECQARVDALYPKRRFIKRWKFMRACQAGKA